MERRGLTRQESRSSASRPAEQRFSGGRALLLALLLVGLATARSAAKEHPVPLEKNTDTRTCLSCHEEKSKGKVLHTGALLDCDTCHEVRVAKDVTRIKLKATSPAAMCLTCHDDKSAAKAPGKLHPPALRQCTTCHDPHSSANPQHLVKATSGPKGENLCLDCHATGLNVPEKGSRHAALDMGCETCHTTHKTGDAAQREFRAHLTKPTPALCLDCHDAKEAALQKAHNGQPFAATDCVTCHNPHQSNQPKLMQAFTHAPFAGGGCDTCHKPASKDGKVVLTESDGRALCLTCHEDKGKEIEGAKVTHAGAQGDCTSCHNPHAGKTPGFLQPDPVAACTSCHSEVAEEHKKKFPHQPAFEQGCATCHTPHGGPHAKLLRAEGSALCMECHSTAAKPATVEGQPYLTIFDGKVRLPLDYFLKHNVVRFNLKYGLGHPTANHPVMDVPDPQDPGKVRARINCLTCHQPHAGNARAMLLQDQRPGLRFCRTCHKGTLEGAQ